MRIIVVAFLLLSALLLGVFAVACAPTQPVQNNRAPYVPPVESPPTPPPTANTAVQPSTQYTNLNTSNDTFVAMDDALKSLG